LDDISPTRGLIQNLAPPPAIVSMSSTIQDDWRWCTSILRKEWENGKMGKRENGTIFVIALGLVETSINSISRTKIHTETIEYDLERGQFALLEFQKSFGFQKFLFY